MIKIRHLQKAYPNVTPLKDVTVDIKKGDVISVIGPSGTGKSTLLRCLNLLETPTAGEILIDGESITDPKKDTTHLRRKMGMVFQGFNLFPHLTVIENLMRAPMDLLGRSKQEAYDKGMELLRRVGLADKALNYPDELSGGQKQRVAIARTLAVDPEIILFDEPTSALDPTMVREVESVIRDLARQGLTMLVVTHEMQFARDICNRVFYMDDGGIYEDGPPEQIFDNPQKEKTRQFIRRLKVLEHRATVETFDFIGFNASLDGFGRKNKISQKTIYNLQSYFEEMYMQTILPVLVGETDLYVAVEYAEDTELVTVEIRYGGPSFDPLASADELAQLLIRKAAKEISYKAINQDIYTNSVSAQIK